MQYRFTMIIDRQGTLFNEPKKKAGKFLMKKTFCMIVAACMLLLTACAPSAGEPVSLTATPSGQVQPTSSAAAVSQTKEPIPDGVKDVNILLMGAMDHDFTNEGSAYALTHILITLDTQNRTIKFTTFPYNLGVDVEGESEKVQLQFVCASLGESGAVEVIEDNFGIDIDYWVVMNIHGVAGIVDELGGIEINVESLSLNDTSEHVVSVLKTAWEKVAATGLQILTGVQTSGYFTDTVPENQSNYLVEEELLFRNRHPNILKGVIKAVKALNLDADGLVQIATLMEGRFATDIPDDEWETIAKSALYCIENEPEFYHVPQEITAVKDNNGWNAIGYSESDVGNVQAFVGE